MGITYRGTNMKNFRSKSSIGGILAALCVTGILYVKVIHDCDSNWTEFCVFHISPKVKPLVDDVTIVTAYFNIGEFFKGHKGHVVNTNSYLTWMKVFGRIDNPVVAFFDDEKIHQAFKAFRSKFQEKTKSFLIKRSDLSSFQLRDRVAKIFKSPGYPQHLPNTVVPEYSCIMHAKFELEQKVAEENYFRTKYISWLDIGLFRFDKENFTFGIWLPPNFDPQKVSYSLVGPFKKTLNAKQIVFNNDVWVSGAMNLATVDVILNFTRDYKRFLHYCLDLDFISTDQQVLYGMYSAGIQDNIKPSVKIQTYNSGPGDVYFQLGYSCRNQWFKKWNTTNRPGLQQ